MDNDSSSSGLEDASLSVSPVTQGGGLQGREAGAQGWGSAKELPGAAPRVGARTPALTCRPVCSEAAAEESSLSCVRPEGPVTP